MIDLTNSPDPKRSQWSGKCRREDDTESEGHAQAETNADDFSSMEGVVRRALDAELASNFDSSIVLKEFRKRVITRLANAEHEAWVLANKQGFKSLVQDAVERREDGVEEADETPPDAREVARGAALREYINVVKWIHLYKDLPCGKESGPWNDELARRLRDKGVRFASGDAPSKKEIRAAKRAKARADELDGMDVSAILASPKDGRRASRKREVNAENAEDEEDYVAADAAPDGQASSTAKRLRRPTAANTSEEDSEAEFEF